MTKPLIGWKHRQQVTEKAKRWVAKNDGYSLEMTYRNFIIKTVFADTSVNSWLGNADQVHDLIADSYTFRVGHLYDQLLETEDWVTEDLPLHLHLEIWEYFNKQVAAGLIEIEPLTIKYIDKGDYVTVQYNECD